MTRISSGKKKSGAPAHANRYAYIHNRNSRLTREILAMPIGGICPTCRAVLEWRKRFRKYKPLTVPKRCVRCGEKTVKEAYHVICRPCGAKNKTCAKCLQPWSPKLAPDGTEIIEPLPEGETIMEELSGETLNIEEIEGDLEGDEEEEEDDGEDDGEEEEESEFSE